MTNIKLVTFDLDDTLIKQNSWVVLNRALGVDETEDNRLYALYDSGKITYDEWTNELLAHYKKSGKATRSNIEHALINYELVDGAEDCARSIHEAHIETALISGSIDIVANHVAARLGIQNVFACTKLVFGQDDDLTAIQHSGDEHTAKTEYLKRLISEHSITPHECACIGDGANDKEMFELTGHGITFVGSPIESVAWKVVRSLAEIPPLVLGRR